MRRMDNRGDFLQLLGPDVSTAILNHLDDPSDLVRACSVSRSWHRFGPTKLNGDNSSEWERLKRDHRVYAFLARGLSPSIRTDCLSEPISASSTDNYPDESIRNTLEPGDRVENRASYWSSEGENDPNVPETLTYTLVANLCVVTEIRVQPFQAFFQYGFPIYSSKAVRFRMGYPRRPLEFNNDKLASHEWGDEIIWTYTSPEFPMAQENFLQAFKLPEPVLCIGGILQVELLGRVQRQEMDELYYICVSHVQVLGRPLLQPFDIEVLDPSGLCALNYNLKTQCYESSTQSHETEAAAHVRRFTDILMQLLGNGAVVADHESDEEPPA
ncbi:F-box protein At4g00755-like isoform X4 [Juglans microcarpa x Juglans regia]|uniref:F-box protein At4g00755-like isoform X4 n=1 Tax=Juglans microcarpa x Juglans regia TaxID=2249226 RepID=UPI001B7F3800|nr:F-box protein At4g00755-like isoform X4 [Juglans microcarpa x Juglans regia]